MRPEDAAAAARKKFGNTTQVREEIYRMNTVTFIDTLLHDLRFGLRMLRKNRAFTVAALLTLAIGIGANTAVFSVVNSVLLKPLRYPDSDRLISLRQTAPGAAGLADVSDGLLLSPSMYFTYAEHNRTFQSMGVWVNSTANVTGLAEPEQVRVVAVSDGILQSLAVSPVAGRWLSTADQIPQGPKTVMLSYGYWQHRFGGDRSVVGRTIRVDSLSRQIVGVMPQGFRIQNTDFDLMAPLAFDRSKVILAGFGYHGIARLKPGVTLTQANADLVRMLPIWMDSWTNGPGSDPHFYKVWRITPGVRPLKKEVIGNIGDVLWVVMGTIGLVMLIACANITNLLLVKAEGRQQELAIRAALGAKWSRLLRELFVESILLVTMGGVLGLVLAYESLKLLLAIGPSNLPRLAEISLDARALAFTLLLLLLASLFFALIPALKYAGGTLQLALRSVGRTASASRERHRARNVLVVVQVAIALVLLVSAGLMIRTFEALRNVAPGFADGQHLQTMRISIPPSLVPEPERVTRMQNEIADKLAAIPGVASVGFADQMPMEGFGSDWDMIYEQDKANIGDVSPLRLYKNVSPGFFHTVGTRLIAGRDLTWNEVYGHIPVALVSENLAKELWGSPAAAIGKHIREVRSMPWHEVIGVVQNVSQNGVDEIPPPTVYWPTMMNGLFGGKADTIRTVTFVIRSERAGTQSFVSQVQQAIWAADSNLPVASLRTMEDIYDRSLSRTSFTLMILATAGSMALVLGVVGIYGVISYSVSQRRREMGIRLALGAPEGVLRRMFVLSGLGLVGIGAAVGLVTAAGLTRLMSSLLFGISPLDPLTYAAVIAVLGTAAVFASYFPARRAAKVDPVEILKTE
jgi:predicted permease